LKEGKLVVPSEMFMRVLHRNLVPILFSLAFVAIGCNKGPVMYQVSGKVLYKDGSVPRGGVAVVNFTPTKDSKAEFRRNASGAIGPDGSFTMFTRVSGDGVNAGEYGVVFNVAKGPMDPTSLILPKYSNTTSPPYKVLVDHNISDLEYSIEPLPGVGTGGASKNGGAQ
jgi:hypothetical protein